MDRNDLIEKIIRLSPSLPGARRLTPENLARQGTDVLQKQVDRLEAVASARVKVEASPQHDAELVRLHEERVALVRRMRGRLDQVRILKNAPAAPETSVAVSASKAKHGSYGMYPPLLYPPVLYATHGTLAQRARETVEITKRRFDVPSNDEWPAVAQAPTFPSEHLHGPFVVKSKGPRRFGQHYFSRAVVEKVTRATTPTEVKTVALQTFIADQTSVKQADVSAVLEMLDGVIENNNLNVVVFGDRRAGRVGKILLSRKIRKAKAKTRGTTPTGKRAR